MGDVMWEVGGGKREAGGGMWEMGNERREVRSGKRDVGASFARPGWTKSSTLREQDATGTVPSAFRPQCIQQEPSPMHFPPPLYLF